MERTAQTVTRRTAIGGAAFAALLLAEPAAAKARGVNSPTVTPSSRASGAGITPYESLAYQGSVEATANSLSSPSQLSFLSGTFPFVNFDSNSYGALFWINVLGLRGSGVGQTVFQMQPYSSTKAGLVPAQSTGSTNQLTLVRTGSSDQSVGRSPILSDFSLLGTSQGHLYNGLNIYCAVNAQVTDVKIKGIPGDSSANPGETFSLNNYKSNATTVTRLEIDGTDANGTRIGASGVGVNSTLGFTISDSSIHDLQYGYGITCWDCTGTISYTRVRSNRNMLPFNFEQCVATVNITASDFTGGRAVTTDGTNPVHMIVDGNKGSSRVTVIDPVFDGAKFTVCIHSTYPYGGPANAQRASDIALVVGGVARPDLLSIVTDYKTTTTGTGSTPIQAHYNQLGGSSGFLGAQVTPETALAGGAYAGYRNGLIYYSGATGAFEVHGGIRSKWAALGSEAGLLGYPLTDESPTRDGVGRVSRFQGGSVHWSPWTGAFEVHGGIGAHFAALGEEGGGVLGYPTSDELRARDGVGRYNTFQYGVLYWSPATGAHEVHGAIGATWRSMGSEASTLGYPVSDEYYVPGARRSDFQRGSIVWNAATGAVTILR